MVKWLFKVRIVDVKEVLGDFFTAYAFSWTWPASHNLREAINLGKRANRSLERMHPFSLSYCSYVPRAVSRHRAVHYFRASWTSALPGDMELGFVWDLGS